MKRISVVSLALVLLLLVPIMPTVAFAQEEWRDVIGFIGKSDKTTETFYISGTKWRINWTVQETVAGMGIFGFFVYPEGETVMYVESVMHSDGSASDTTYVYKGNSNFYIKVLAANLEMWAIEVEQYIGAPPPKPTPSPTTPTPAPAADDEGCFIATAAYGSPLAEEIDVLREFRDEVLLQNSLSATFTSLYYKFSLPIADFISQHDVLRTIVREGFVAPLAAILEWSHNLWSEESY